MYSDIFYEDKHFVLQQKVQQLRETFPAETVQQHIDQLHLQMIESMTELEDAAHPTNGDAELKNWARERWICRCDEYFPTCDPRRGKFYLAIYTAIFDISGRDEEFHRLQAAQCPQCQCTNPSAFLALQ